jgi:hypothetical protein
MTEMNTTIESGAKIDGREEELQKAAAPLGTVTAVVFGVGATETTIVEVCRDSATAWRALRDWPVLRPRNTRMAICRPDGWVSVRSHKGFDVVASVGPSLQDRLRETLAPGYADFGEEWMFGHAVGCLLAGAFNLEIPTSHLIPDLVHVWGDLSDYATSDREYVAGMARKAREQAEAVAKNGIESAYMLGFDQD